MKKLLALVLAGALIMGALTACGGGNDAPSGGNTGDPSGSGGGETNIAYYAVYVDPILQWDPSGSVSNEVMVFNNLYETLLRYDPASDSFEYVLATDYTVSEDGLTWNFTIREGATFHDGTPVNAEAVRFSIDRTITKGQGQAYLWDAVESIEAVGEYEVQFNLKYSAPIDIICAATSGAYIYSPTAVQENGEDWFNQGNECGSGPYQMRDFKMGDNVILEKYEDYWGGWEEGQYDIAVVEKVPESSSRRQLIESGEADLTNMLPAEDIAAMREVEGVNIVEAASLKNVLACFNTAEGPTADPLVRQALAMAIPYDEIIQTAAGGYASRSSGYVPASLWGHSDELGGYDYDLDKARELLTQAGYPDGGFTLVLTYQSGDETLRKLSELYRSSLSELGIELDIRALTWDSQWDMARSTDPADRQDILIEYWMLDIASPYSWLNGVFHTEEQPLQNLSYYSNPEVDALIEEANALSGTDREAAAAKFAQVQELVLADVPVVSVCDVTDVWALSSAYGNFTPNAAYPMVARFYEGRVAQ